MIFTLTIKQLAANKIRLLATSAAIILGVAFLAGTLILTDTIKGTLNDVLAEADAGTDAYVRSSSALELGYGQTAQPIDASLIDDIREVDGVDQISISVSGYAQILDKSGKAVGDPSTGVLGMNWVTIPKLNPFTLSSGRAPKGPNEIAIDKHSAKIAKLKVGDQTTVLSSGEPRAVTIVGITRFGNVDTPGALSVVLFDDDTAQAVLNTPGEVDAIAVTAQPGVSPDTLVARLAPVIQTTAPHPDRSHLRGNSHQRTPTSNQPGHLPIRDVPHNLCAHRTLRWGVHHQQHVLDHRVATNERNGPLASCRRNRTPSAACCTCRSRGDWSCCVSRWGARRDWCGERTSITTKRAWY
jgi:MacB-like periplasmic core domain